MVVGSCWCWVDFFFSPLKSQTPRRPKKVLSVWFFVLFASQLPCCEYFVHQIQKFVGFFFCSTRMKLHNNNKNNKNKKQKEETERGGVGPLPAHKFESKCSVRPAVSAHGLLAPRAPAPLPARNRAPGGRGALQPQEQPSPFLLLAGALLPQSSEIDRRLKMGRRRPGSRLGDSEPLRLPELNEPLK